MNQAEPYPDNLTHVRGALLVLNLALHRQVLRWRATHHPQAGRSELAGLYISDREADAVLDALYGVAAPPDADEIDQNPIATLNSLLERASADHAASESIALMNGVSLRLPLLAARLGLTPFERAVIALCLAPAVDRQYERVFAYLNDDTTMRQPTVDLALQIFAGGWPERAGLRSAFDPDAPLRALRLIQVEEGARLSATLRIEESVAAFLLGADLSDTLLAGQLAAYEDRLYEALLAAALELAALSADKVVLEGPDEALQLAAAAYLSQGLPLLVLDASGLANPSEVIARALRTARLQEAALAIKAAHELPERVLRLFLDAPFPLPRYLLAERSLACEAVRLHLPALDTEARWRLWAASLDGVTPDIDLAELADRFRLSGKQIAAAAAQALAHAAAFAHPITRDALFASCRAQMETNLVEPVRSIHTWNELVLPPAPKNQLLSLENWMRYRHTVYQEWGFNQRVMLGKGLAVLFSGPSGTGKTMAAGILARNLGLDLYRIDLSAVVSKYIGETEKNLSVVFETAERANAMLFFDEADSLFGKRSEVKDAHDRYANIEISYLLQRMETYDGLAILATNFRQNIDHAFIRRLQMIVEFPLPNISDRARIWRRLLPSTVPQSREVDMEFLAEQFALSGGSIKNCALAAAFAAARDGSPITMQHLIQAVAQELEKAGQPLVRAAFGPYYDLVRVS